MTIPAADLRAKLTGKFGFAPVKPKGNPPHEKYRLEVDGQYVAHTQLSRGSFDIGDKLAGMIARQLGVTSKQLREMVDCTLDRDAYVEHLNS